MNGRRGKHPVVMPPIVLEGIVDELESVGRRFEDVCETSGPCDATPELQALRAVIEVLRAWVPK